MRLLLTLLALLTGLATADRAAAAPAVPAAMGSLVLLAEAAGQADVADSDRRPSETTPTRRTASSGDRKARRSAAPHVPGLLVRGTRALE